MSSKPTYKELEQRIRDLEIVENERRRMEVKLQENSERHSAMIANIGDVIGIMGTDGIMKYKSSNIERWFGWKPEDLVGTNGWDTVHPEDIDCMQKEFFTLLGKDHSMVTVEYRYKCKDNTYKWIELTAVNCTNDPSINGVLLNYHDITERKQAEKMLREANDLLESRVKERTKQLQREIDERKQAEEALRISQKFEAIGTLASGIAHDFNNLLMGILGRASLISSDLDPFHRYLEHTNAIEDYVRSATDLTKQLLGLTRGGKYEVKPTDINELVRDSVNMFGRTKKEIRIHTNFIEPPPVVMVDRNQIEQVLLNLYINAWQAMPGGGELYLETQPTILEEAYCKPYNAKPGHYVKVSVADTGIGMDRGTKRRIFDPFFTTKEMSRGTGLGLASAYGIIKNHDGIIMVKSELGQGTIFNIYLPLSDKEAYRAAPITKELIKGSEAVLLVDDEEMILEVGEAMLETLGYSVIVVPDGGQAIELVKQKGAEIELVILDLIMPGLEGGKVFDRIREIQPALPVILSSGYSLNGEANDIMQRGCNGFIQKPFNISELSQKIRKILDEVKIS